MCVCVLKCREDIEIKQIIKEKETEKRNLFLASVALFWHLVSSSARTARGSGGGGRLLPTYTSIIDPLSS